MFTTVLQSILHQNITEIYREQNVPEYCHMYSLLSHSMQATLYYVHDFSISLRPM